MKKAREEKAKEGEYGMLPGENAETKEFYEGM